MFKGYNKIAVKKALNCSTFWVLFKIKKTMTTRLSFSSCKV